MIVRGDGRIAFHCYQIREDGLWLVQFGFGGEVLYEQKVRDYRVALVGCSTA